MKRMMICLFALFLVLGFSAGVYAQAIGPLHKENGLGFDVNGTYLTPKFKDVKNDISVYLASAGINYAFLNAVTVYGNIGVAKINVKDGILTGVKDFDSGWNNPYFNVGAKVAPLVYQATYGSLYLGVFADYFRILGDPKDSTSYKGVNLEDKLSNMQAFRIGVGPQFKFNEYFEIYGGYLYSKLDGDATFTASAGGKSASDKQGFEGDKTSGGFAGVQVSFTKNFKAYGEWDYQWGGNSFTIGLKYDF